MEVVDADFEIFSEVSIKDVGLDNYVNHPTTDIICMAYSIGAEITKLWRPGRGVPNFPSHFVLVAHNVNFEKAIWEAIAIKKYGFPIPSAYRCTAAKAAYMTYPRTLEGASKALRLPLLKDTIGKSVMLQVTKPRRPSKTNPDENWFGNKDKMNTTYRYCIQDVDVEKLIDYNTVPLPPFEEEVFLLDRAINARGIYVDRDLAESAIVIANQYLDRLNNTLYWLSGCAIRGVTKEKDIKAYLEAQGFPMASIAKDFVTEALARDDLSPKVRKVLELRQKGGLTSLAKYQKILNWTSPDGRLRNIFMYYGAATGRWTGKGPQLHNLPQGVKVDKEEAIALIKQRDIRLLDAKYDSPMAVLSACIRQTFLAEPGKVLIAGDFASIEVRVLAWLAGQDDLLELLRRGEDPYVDMASSIYKVAVGDVTSDQRAIGKMAVLGLGYSMGWDTFMKQCAKRGIVITEKFAKEVVKTYRKKYKAIVAFWKKIERVMATTLEDGEERSGKLHMYLDGMNIRVKLPSGRDLHYIHVLKAQNRWGEQSLSHKTTDSKTKQWVRRETYGGMLTENITQAIARDFLAEAMLRIDAIGYNQVLHVHDETVVECTLRAPLGASSYDESIIKEQMEIIPDWGKGCPIAVETWCQERYQKG